MSHGADMLSGFLTTLGAMIANRKLLGSWLVLLTLSVGAIGDKVFVSRTEEMTVVKMKLEAIEKTLDEINATTKENSAALTQLLVEQARVKTQLEAHEKSGK